MNKGAKYLIGLTRITLGWVLVWSFMDQLWGLGYNTEPENSWLEGVSPTAGFLTNTVTEASPLYNTYQDMIGEVWVDWVFMLGLAGIGLALILGICNRLAGLAGAVLMISIYLAIYPPVHNPLVTEHLIYALIMLYVAVSPAGEWLGLRRWWSETALVSRLPFLK